jgi:cytochrome P450
VTARRPPDVEQLTEPSLYATGDPFALYAALRRDSPVAWHAGRGFWAVTTHPEVATIGTDPAAFASSRGILVDEIGTTYEAPPTMMHTDPPQHTAYRRMVQPGFKPALVRAMEDGVARKAAELIEAIEPGVAVDIVPALAVPFPLLVICELLGVDGTLWPRFFEWSEAVIPGETDRSAEERASLQADMWTYLVGVAEERRRRPAGDLVSALAAVHRNGGADDAGGEASGLSEAELAMFLIQLLVAGNETTRNLISGGLVALAEHPAQWQALRADPTLLPSAVEELLRWTTPVISFMRTATRATTVRGQDIAEGDPVLLLYASANRDEAVFGPDAEQLHVERYPNPHLSFGFGPHFCLGAALARLEARLVLTQLLRRFSTLELAGPVTRTASPVIAGVRQAPLAFA